MGSRASRSSIAGSDVLDPDRARLGPIAFPEFFAGKKIISRKEQNVANGNQLCRVSSYRSRSRDDIFSHTNSGRQQVPRLQAFETR
jgi:hypothetical protein